MSATSRCELRFLTSPFPTQIAAEDHGRATSGCRMDGEDVGAAAHNWQTPAALAHDVGQRRTGEGIDLESRARIDDCGHNFVVLELAAYLDDVGATRMFNGVCKRLTHRKDELLQRLPIHI